MGILVLPLNVKKKKKKLQQMCFESITSYSTRLNKYFDLIKIKRRLKQFQLNVGCKSIFSYNILLFGLPIVISGRLEGLPTPRRGDKKYI